MLSCKRATELIEKRTFVGLSFKEKVQLSMHKSMCDACTAYEKQSKKIDELLKNSGEEDAEKITIQSNQQLKESILKKLP